MYELHFAGVSAYPSRPKGLLGVQISLIILPIIHCKMFMKVVFFFLWIHQNLTWITQARNDIRPHQDTET